MILGTILFFIALLLYTVLIVKKKQLHWWLFSYLQQHMYSLKEPKPDNPIHIIFCFIDHFEPRWNNASYEQETKRICIWIKKYPEIAKRYIDADGRYPQHTFFYPAEEYRPEHLEKLALVCKEGFGEIEIHLHHEDDTSDGFKEKLIIYKEQLVQHGLLSYDRQERIRYGFIHGNWALDNARGDGKFCGVNNELEILKDTGCYADFTLPSAPSDTQTKKINSIYYAKDNPDKPKSHNTGIDVEAGKRPMGDLMIIQGPLTLNWKNRKYKIFPRIENGEVSDENPPTEERVDLWIREHICVKGRPDWVLVKVYTHGAQEKNFDTLLGEEIGKMFSYLEQKYNDSTNYLLHYVTAREMFNIIKAAEAGLDGNPGEYRDYILKRKH